MSENAELIDLYKIVVDTITANEQRRQQVTTTYLTVFAGGMAALGALKDIDPIFLAIPAIPVSLIWYSSVRYFRRLAKAKFAVIGQMEKEFCLQPFELEWKHFKHQPKRFSWLPDTLRGRFGLTQLEMLIPAILAVSATAYLFWRLLNLDTRDSKSIDADSYRRNSLIEPK